MRDGIGQGVPQAVPDQGTTMDQRFAEALVQASPTIIYVFNVPEQRIIYASRQMTAVLGYTAEDVADQPAQFMQRILHPEDAARMASLLRRWDTATDDDLLEVEYRAVAKDGRWHWFHATDKVFRRDENGRVIEIIGCASDITPQKELEQRLNQAEKLEALGSMANAIAHDFNNIVGAIIGYADLAMTELEDATALRDDLKEILRSARRAAELSARILAFGRATAIERRLVDVGRVAEEVTAQLRAGLREGKTIKLRVAPEIPPVLADEVAVYQILMNIGRNAVDAIQARGSEVQFRIGKSGDFVAIQVEDNGPGIHPSIQPRIFEPFFTTRPSGVGTGLGLATVARLTQALGGSVTVNSKPGAGATFEVRLPAGIAAVAPAVATTETPLPDIDLPEEEVLRFLLVDDDAEMLGVIGRLLARLGHRSERYENPHHALEAWRDMGRRFDAAIVDFQMPSLSGVELCGMLRSRRPGCPVYLCTGYGTLFSPTQLAQLGFSGMITKPPTLEVVREVAHLTANPVGEAAMAATKV